MIHYLADSELSLKSKGLLSILLTLPDFADKSVKSLGLYCQDGRDSILSSLRELEDVGYVKRGRARYNGHLGAVIIESTATREE